MGIRSDISLVAVFVFLASGLLAAHASDDTVFEAGVSAGWSWDGYNHESPGSSGSAARNGADSHYFAAKGTFNLWLSDASIEFMQLPLKGQRYHQFSVSASALGFLQLHELYIRRMKGDDSDSLGNYEHYLFGAGGRWDLPRYLGSISAGVGAILAGWQRPGGEQQSMKGAYVGSSLHLRVWKFSDELRVAYYVTHDAVRDLKHGVVGTNRLYFEVLRLPLSSIGPEVWSQVRQLPDGLEWLATVGFAATLAY